MRRPRPPMPGVAAMVDLLTRRRWIYRFALVGLAALLIFCHILPLGTGPGSWPAPDLLIALIFAWVMRRPEYVPAPLIGLLVLLTDMLFMRPPGLWAALAVMGTEFLRGRQQFSREMPFPVEWLMVSVVLAAMVIGNRLVLAIFMVDQAGLGLTLLQMMTTIAAYPFVVLFTTFVLRIRKVALGEVDELGHRL